MSDIIRLVDGVVYMDRREVHRPEGVQRISPNEARLLAFLAASPGKMIPTETLLTEVWGYRDGVRSRTVATTVQRLRGKLEADPRNPVHLHTVWGEGYRWQAVDAPELTQPTLTRGFVGRRAELESLMRAGLRGGVVELVGPGGVGKTRLAREWLGNCPLPTVFVGLADARSRRDVLVGLAEALGLSLRSPDLDTATRQLVDGVRLQGEILLVADNVEQVKDAATTVLGALVAGCPELRLVVTSRVALGLEGAASTSLEPLTIDQSVELLNNRAASTGVELDPAATTQLASRLGGLPLALELAAARLRLLPAEELTRQLADRLDVLVQRGGPARQQTLHAVVAWSWDLLDDAEREALAAATVFDGGFGVSGAQAVLGPAALERLEALLDHHLVQHERSPQGARFRLFPFVRHFASEALPDVVDVARGAHLTWAAEVCRTTLPEVPRADGAAALATLGRELENLVAAARVGPARDLGATAWVLRGLVQLAYLQPAVLPLSLVDDALARATDAPEDVRQVLQVVRARRALRTPDLPLARQALAEAERLEAHAPDTEMAMAPRRLAAELAMYEGDYDRALALLDEVMARVDEGSDEAVGSALAKATLLSRQERVTEAEALLVRTLAACRGRPYPEGIAAGSLARIYRLRHRMAEAEQVARRARDLLVELGDRWVAGACAHNLASICLHAGRFEEAVRESDEAAEMLRRVGNRYSHGQALITGGQARLALGRVDEAREAFTAGLLELRLHGEPRAHANAVVWLAIAELRAGRSDMAWSSLEPAIDTLESLRGVTRRTVCALASMARSARGDPGEAERWLAEVEATSALAVLAGAWLHIARARVAEASGDRRGGREERAEAARLVASLTDASGARVEPLVDALTEALRPHL